MLEQYKDNEIVKSLLEAGLDEEYILDGIEKGEIKVEKSEKEEKTDKDETKETGEEVKTETTDEDDEDLEEMEKACGVKKAELLELEGKLAAAKAKKEGKKEKKEEKIEKGEGSEIGQFDTETFEKSLSEKLEKSLSSILDEKLGEMKEELELLKSENESLRSDVDTISKTGVDFKAPENLAYIEKGMEMKEIKDSAGKQMLHITKQREAVKDVLLKAYDEAENDSEIKKSIANELSAYASDTEAQSIDERVAKHLYDKHSVRLLK